MPGLREPETGSNNRVSDFHSATDRTAGRTSRLHCRRGDTGGREGRAADKKGGIYVLSPEGKLLAFLPVPKDEVTNCAFGGDDLKTLYFTAGGTLYSVRTMTPGRVVWPTSK